MNFLPLKRGALLEGEGSAYLRGRAGGGGLNRGFTVVIHLMNFRSSTGHLEFERFLFNYSKISIGIGTVRH